MPGQKRATPPVERDPTNAPSTAAAATGAARRSERGRGCIARRLRDSFPRRALCGVRRRCSYPFASIGACTIVQNSLAEIELRRPKIPQLAVAPKDPQLAVARLAFGWRLAGGGGRDFILGVFAPIRAIAGVLVHVRIHPLTVDP